MAVTAPRIGVLALQGDVREHVAALTRVGAEPVEVRRPEELDGLDGIVLPGGESTTMGRLLDTFGMLEPLRGLLKTGLPAYGTCAGMILLAHEVVDGRDDQPLLGGLDITVRRNAFGSQVDSFEQDVDVDGIDGGPVRSVFIRAPWVQEVGPAAVALGRVSDGAAAGRVVAVRQGNLLATSFHPELTGDGRIHAYFCEMVRQVQ